MLITDFTVCRRKVIDCCCVIFIRTMSVHQQTMMMMNLPGSVENITESLHLLANKHVGKPSTASKWIIQCGVKTQVTPSAMLIYNMQISWFSTESFLLFLSFFLLLLLLLLKINFALDSKRTVVIPHYYACFDCCELCLYTALSNAQRSMKSQKKSSEANEIKTHVELSSVYMQML